MANKTIQSLRGMKDIVNEESALFTYFVDKKIKIDFDVNLYLRSFHI